MWPLTAVCLAVSHLTGRSSTGIRAGRTPLVSLLTDGFIWRKQKCTLQIQYLKTKKWLECHEKAQCLHKNEVFLLPISVSTQQYLTAVRKKSVQHCSVLFFLTPLFNKNNYIPVSEWEAWISERHLPGRIWKVIQITFQKEQ